MGDDLTDEASAKEVSIGYSLRELFCDVREDFRALKPKGLLRILFALAFDMRFQLLALYRLSRWLVAHHLSVLCLPLRWLQLLFAASEISPYASLGRRVLLAHPTGIVIGQGVVIEEDVCLFQQVTLGSHGRRTEGARYPVVCKGARIYAGAKIIGGIRIGQGAIVGANSVVIQDVPEWATAVGNPARVQAPKETNPSLSITQNAQPGDHATAF